MFKIKQEEGLISIYYKNKLACSMLPYRAATFSIGLGHYICRYEGELGYYIYKLVPVHIQTEK